MCVWVPAHACVVCVCAGCSDDEEGTDSHADASVSELWRDMCHKLIVRMGRRHPYLRTVCKFLYAHSAASSGVSTTRHDLGQAHAASADADLSALNLWQRSPYFEVLAELGVALSDRVAFACRFLPDAEVGSPVSSWHIHIGDAAPHPGVDCVCALYPAVFLP